MIGTQHTDRGRALTITGEYYDGPGDHGYEYHYNDEPLVKRWCSTNAANVRWLPLCWPRNDREWARAALTSC